MRITIQIPFLPWTGKPALSVEIDASTAAQFHMRAAADKLDNEYGAICASGHPIFEGSDVAKSFTCTPATIALEHELELAFLDAEGFALASQQVENR